MKKISTLAALVCGLTLSLTVLAAGNIDAGKALVEKNACAGCHGADMNSPAKINTPDDAGFPRLAGQPQDYLEHTLTSYKHPDSLAGRSNALMEPVVKNLSKQDIKDIAAYIHSLPGNLQVRR